MPEPIVTMSLPAPASIVLLPVPVLILSTFFVPLITLLLVLPVSDKPVEKLEASIVVTVEAIEGVPVNPSLNSTLVLSEL